MTINLDLQTINFSDKRLKKLVSEHTEYEYTLLKQTYSKPHSSLKEYFKHLLTNMAMVFHHIKDVQNGISEYDDQLSIKVKKGIEKQHKCEQKMSKILFIHGV